MRIWAHPRDLGDHSEAWIWTGRPGLPRFCLRGLKFSGQGYGGHSFLSQDWARSHNLRTTFDAKREREKEEANAPTLTPLPLSLCYGVARGGVSSCPLMPSEPACLHFYHQVVCSTVLLRNSTGPILPSAAANEGLGQLSCSHEPRTNFPTCPS